MASGGGGREEEEEEERKGESRMRGREMALGQLFRKMCLFVHK